MFSAREKYFGLLIKLTSRESVALQMMRKRLQMFGGYVMKYTSFRHNCTFQNGGNPISNHRGKRPFRTGPRRVLSA